MRFTIPQFIEHEPKIVGPLTFKQFIFVGIAGAICFVLYFTVSFSIFILSCIVLGGIALAFAFLKIGGIPLAGLLGHFLKYNLSPKMYLWKKKEEKKPVFKERVIKQEPVEEDKLPLKIAGESQLKKIKTKIETKTK